MGEWEDVVITSSEGKTGGGCHRRRKKSLLSASGQAFMRRSNF